MNLYIFSQQENIFEMYTDFTILAKSEDDAWKMIEKAARKDLWNVDAYVLDRSKYNVEKVPLNKPYISCHYSCG